MPQPLSPHFGLAQLKAAKSVQDMAKLLGYKPNKLSWVVFKMPGRYKQFSIPKRSGGVRVISAPAPELKLLQRRLAAGLQECWAQIELAKNIRRPISHGFRKGASIVTNAAVHRRRRFVFNVDIVDFFGSITFGRVWRYFEKNRDFALSTQTAKLIAQIACDGGKLPQGSPCSPVISNLIGQILDVRLAMLAKKHGCSYSRYADDLTFSTNEAHFPAAIAVEIGTGEWLPGQALTTILKKSYFELNPAKTRMQYRNSRQEVTGLLVNKRINVRPEYRKLVRAMTHHLTTKGTFHIRTKTVDAAEQQIECEDDGDLNQLQGMFGFIDWIDQRHLGSTKLTVQVATGEKSHMAPAARTSTERTYKRFLMHRDFWSSEKPLILCEGKTDSIYIRGAIRRLLDKHPLLAKPAKKNGEVEYAVRFFNYSRTAQRVLGLAGGADCIRSFIADYVRWFKTAPKFFPKQPVILLIDHDEAGKKFHGMIKNHTGTKEITGNEDFHHLKANVYIVFTPIIGSGDSSTIEDLFDQNVLETRLDGKKFNPSNEKLDDATEYGKWAFATHVIRPHVSNLDFSKFDGLLGRFETVIKHHQAQAK